MSFLLLENSDKLLLESGGRLLLQDDPGFTVSIAANSDDGDIRGTSFNQNSEVEMGRYESNKHWGFFRFQLPSAIPAGATITAARITFRGTGTFSWNTGGDLGPDDLTIRATDSADAAQPTAAGHRPSVDGGSTATTDAIVTWPDVPWNSSGNNVSADFSSVVQELVDSFSGLASGAYVCIWIALVDTGVTSEGDLVKLAAYEHATLDPASLEIQFSSGAAAAVSLPPFSPISRLRSILSL